MRCWSGSVRTIMIASERKGPVRFGPSSVPRTRIVDGFRRMSPSCGASAAYARESRRSLASFTPLRKAR